MNRAGFIGRLLAAFAGLNILRPTSGQATSGQQLQPPLLYSDGGGKVYEWDGPPPCPRCGGRGYVRATAEQTVAYGWASEPEPRGPKPKRESVTLFCPECHPIAIFKQKAIDDFVRTYPRRSV